jgi:hypothetical protein
VRYRYVSEPHPHIFIEEIVPPEVYAAMSFPDHLIMDGAPWGITTSDDAWEEVMQQPAWRALYDVTRGEDFVRSVLRAFAEEMRRDGCLVDADSARLSGRVETRSEKELRTLEVDSDANEIFTRLDFQSKSGTSYREFVHLDWARRIVGGILFFSDAEEEGIEGGELAMYRDRRFQNDRWCHEPELTAMFPVRKNTGVIFLNSNRGFHGPRSIRAAKGRRRWLYYTISSSVDVWPCESRSSAAAPLAVMAE